MKFLMEPQWNRSFKRGIVKLTLPRCFVVLATLSDNVLSIMRIILSYIG